MYLVGVVDFCWFGKFDMPLVDVMDFDCIGIGNTMGIKSNILFSFYQITNTLKNSLF
jgi:hypothetical protein